MTSKQSNRLSMYIAVQVYLLSSTTATAALSAIADKLALLVTLITQLRKFHRLQEQPIAGTLEAREVALADATDLALTVAGAVRSYANPLDLPKLRAEVKVNYSSFIKMRRVARMGLAQRIYDAALPVIAHLAPFGVTAATLEELQTKISEATDAVSAPRVTTAEKKVATSQLEETCRVIDDVLKNEIDPLMFGLRKKNPEVYRLYQEARLIFDRPGGGPADPDPATPATPTDATTSTVPTGTST